MLLKNKIFRMLQIGIIGFISFFMSTSCGGTYVEGGSIGVGVDVYSDLECTVNLVGISGTLRNDSMSNDVLRTGTSDIVGCLMIGIRDGDFSNDTYEGVDLETELDAIKSGTSKFYIRINDSESESFNSSYKTINVSCNTPDVYGGEVNIYLPKK